MDLSGLKSYLESKGDPLTLGAADANLPQELQDFLHTVPNKQVTLSPKPSGIVLQGSALTISGTSSDTWPVQGMGNVVVSLSDVGITITNGSGSAIIDAIVHAALPLTPTVRVPVVITALHQDSNPWQIKLAQQAKGVTPTDVLLLGKVGSLPFDIPSNLDVLSQALAVEPDQFQITFYPNTTFDAWYQFQLSAPSAKWPLITNILSFDGIDIQAFVATNALTVVLTGHLTIDGIGVDVGVALNTGEDWGAFVRPSAGKFPGVAALAAWIAGSDGTLASETTSGFSALQFNVNAFDLALEAVSVGFNYKTASLNYLDITSLLTVGGMPLDVVLRLPDISIVGSLHEGHPVKVKDMLSSFGLATDNVPDNLSITAVEFMARARQSFYSAGLTVDNIWQAGPVNLEEISVLVSYFGAEGFTGQFNCKLGIGATTTLYLEAQYAESGTGWIFSGGTEPGSSLSIGDLLLDLAGKFGIADVPQPIKSLSLTNLSVSYETGTGKFSFTCEGDFTVVDTPVRLVVTIAVVPSQSGDENKPQTIKGTKGYSATFGGQVIFGTVQFDLLFNTQSLGTSVFVADYVHTGKQANISLRDLVADVSTSVASVIPDGLSIDLKEVKFIFLEQNQTKQFAFGLGLDAAINLSDLPLVGDKLPAGETIAVKNLQVTYSTQAFSKDQVGVVNPLLPLDVTKLPADGLAQGINFAADMQLGDTTRPLGLGVPQQPGAPAQPATGAESGGPSDQTSWINIQKQLGIFQFKRIGVQYQNNTLLFALDAAMGLGPLTFSMDGLSIGSPLSEFKPVFDLSGLGLSYIKPPLEITGALLKLPGAQLAPDTQFQFDGMVVVKAEQYSLAAIGSYAQFKSGDPSLFVFAQLEAALGGPPAFFVTGLMAGFGFNRMLTIPAQDQVLDFPLLLLAQPPGPGGQAQKQDPMHVLDILEGRAPVNGKTKAWIAPQPGEYWLAAGLEFMSFELVRSKALLIVEFGNDLTIALLGLSTLQLPQLKESSQTYAYVEMQLRVVLKPQEGSFAATAILSKNSYLIAPDCHLTGGFAFYLWFGPNEHAGDFVITLGGYHPAFKPPSHFPIVPRLGFNWAVSDVVSIKGEAYFALTNSCIMAGGGLQVLFHYGDLQAWFTAQADFLVSWRPFFYLANIDVSIGVSYRFNFFGCHKTLSVSVGASLDLWGPPTGGRVHVNIVVLTFTISFGSDSASQNQKPLPWSDFKTLLPAADSVCRITASSGLYKTQDSDKDSSGKLWIVRAKDFGFFTQSAIPASHLQYGTALQSELGANAGNDAGKTPAIDIRPMNLTGVTSTHTLKIFKGDTSTPPVDVSKWTLTPRTLNVPESLWGAPPDPFTQIPDRPTANVVPNQMVGYTVQAPPPDPGDSRGLIPLTVLLEEYIQPAGAAPFSPSVSKAPRYVPTFSDQTVGQIQQIMSTTVKQHRDTLYAILSKAGIYSGDNGPVSDLASDAGHLYSDSPMQQS